MSQTRPNPNKSSGRGGRREGAGRKNEGLSKRVTVCLTKELLPVFKKKGGGAWLRKQLEAKESTELTALPGIYFPADTPSRVRVPVYNDAVQAGFPSPAESYIDRKLDLNEFLVPNPAATFFVYVSGDSMNLAGMDEGDMLIVDRSKEPKNGDIVIMDIGNEFTVKRYEKTSAGIRLLPQSSNPLYKPLIPKEYEEWRFIGVVTHTIKRN